MSKNTSILLKALGTTFLIYIVVNVVALAISLIGHDFGGNHNYRFDDGAFYIDGHTIGLPLGTFWGGLVLIVILGAAFAYHYQREQKKQVAANATED